ncbi:MAG: bifunctional demethylmenaquinone methyltransferase/2-methoxy-6-polyprenyl-1,4-benzoquinol methylase UbiE [Porticoccus sp.]|jgi:demethylmenaquinone methyltransferase/2-methoxy-6-polyprenyl-1,4-benzoquinol methylase|nr:bifunctional demethylmenaquinone methyltransferase/2-methoxy-6-polyprenyl-1,4-benzoquinol methylase UbiE [Porticoccus sp.]
MEDNKTTHFGFEQVPVEEKATKVADVFRSVAGKYDLMNDLMSVGIHRLWKRYAVNLSGVRAGQSVLDVAGGTGDLTLKFSKIVGEKGKVVLLDINESMLKIGRDKLIDAACSNEVFYTLGDAQNLPFPDNTFDCITIAFGLRNVTDKEMALRSMYRILKSGGRLLILEFSEPSSAFLKKTYDFYSFKLLPKIGKFVANDSQSYQYLAESIRMHPDQTTLKNMMVQANFSDTEYYNMTGGIVCLHRGFKT